VQVLRTKPSKNLDIINEYITTMQTEINLSKGYKTLTVEILTKLSRFHKDKPFANMKREDIIAYINSLRKPDAQDPMHKWIGTYNLYLMCIKRFFKWIYKPALDPKQRPKPQIIQNIPSLRRKEISIYKPSDLWTLEDDLLFLKWCPNKRDRCYHAISRDLSARPHEILGLKLKDIVFKSVGSKQYAEVIVNGKTGARHLPLIDSLPYIKEWSDQHPQRNNPEAYFICSFDRKAFAKQLSLKGLQYLYKHYKKNYFPKLIKDPTLSKEDKRKIEDLLKKPWNLYIRRHSSLTQKSKYLKENILRQHAGWSARSQMHLKYVHYFGNESSESILQEYGILPRDNQEVDVLRPKQCPNCQEPNRPDQKFCAKCKMVLTYDAYNETLEKENLRESELRTLKEKYESDLEAVRVETSQKFNQIMAMIQQNPQLAQIKPNVLMNKSNNA